MSIRQNKEKKREAVTRRLRHRFYKGAAAATAVYVSLSLISFHGGYAQLPHALAITWAVFLLCYTTFKEVLKWNDSDEKESYRGEFWAALVIAGMGWMIGWNIIREWVFHAEALHLPEDYQAATIETIVLYTLSVISSILHKQKKEAERLTKQKLSTKTLNNKTNSSAVVGNRPIVVKQAKNQNIEVVLIKSLKNERKDRAQKES